MKKLSFVFILAGILIILYPTLNRGYNDYQAQKVLQEWQKSMNDISSVETSENLNSEDVNKDDINDNDKYILKIDKIDLYMPVLKGATDGNLDISLSQMNHTAKPGQIGNFAVAGHRSYTYGRHFNRLDEIKKGDIIEVETRGENYKYKVDETIVVEPDELWVLESNDKEKEITLVTCTPIKVASHRLIIKGKLVQ
ncbi:MAG: class D sortase [Senegalia sp. (in: firmicutes)]|uniref:class D sortase n=1 Tax=Senegalia sp. (in: firmicutes) TaxID=1924098 RepID=UPI003F97AEBE